MERLTEDFKRELSAIFRKIKDPRLSSMISVVSVEITKDLKYAKIYVSVMGTEEERKDTMTALKSATGFVKREIGANLKIRAVPDLQFILDRSVDYGVHISELINKIHKEER